MAEYRIIKRAGLYVVQWLVEQQARWWLPGTWEDVSAPQRLLEEARFTMDSHLKGDYNYLASDSTQPHEVIE